MAERRMFAKTIVLSDDFLDMPLTSRCLYFTLGMLADDDGFVNAPKSIMRQCGASEDDLKTLMLKRFVLAFDSGVIVIKHWRINNYLRNDRYTETKYIEEKSQLEISENGSYTFGIPSVGIPSIDKDSIGKVSIGKGSKGKDKEPVVYFPEDEALNQAFEEYIAHRKKLKKPMDAYKCELAIKKLMKLSGGDNDMAIQILKQSIDEGWQGLFELKEKPKAQKNQLDVLADMLRGMEDDN